ncbi:hypothetical protein J6590_048985 [Homalodisca vitripennis]|nr:hypothetical protein J6590_048985 [Homalodisca vitripennis]
MYVSNGPLETPFVNSKLHTLIDRFENVITLHLTLPETDPDTLARMSIPSLSAVQAAATAKQSGDAANPPVEKVIWPIHVEKRRAQFADVCRKPPALHRMSLPKTAAADID